MLYGVKSMLHIAKSPAPKSYKPLEPTQAEPRQPNKAYSELLGAVGPCSALLGRRGSPCLGSNGLHDHSNSEPA